MSQQIERIYEKSILELNQFKELKYKLFEDDEIEDIVEKRRDFEYKIQIKNPDPQVFQNAIDFEEENQSLLEQRLKQLKESIPNEEFNRLFNENFKLDCFKQRIMILFKKLIRKYNRTDKFQIDQLKYLISIKDVENIIPAFTNAINLLSDSIDIQQLYFDYLITTEGLEEIRKSIPNLLNTQTKDQKLYLRIIKFEMEMEIQSKSENENDEFDLSIINKYIEIQFKKKDQLGKHIHLKFINELIKFVLDLNTNDINKEFIINSIMDSIENSCQKQNYQDEIKIIFEKKYQQFQNEYQKKQLSNLENNNKQLSQIDESRIIYSKQVLNGFNLN